MKNILIIIYLDVLYSFMLWWNNTEMRKKYSSNLLTCNLLKEPGPIA